jgi:hypothetical protein
VQPGKGSGFNLGFNSSLTYNSKTFCQSQLPAQLRDPGIANSEIACRQFDGYQEADYRYYFSCFERFRMAKTYLKYRKAIAVLMLMLSRKRRSWKLSAGEKQRKMMLSMGCNSMHRIKQINAAIAKKEVDIYSLPPGDVPHGVKDSFGDDNMTQGLHILGWDFYLTRILAKQILISCVQFLNWS